MQFLLCPCPLPVGEKFMLMERRPLDHESHRARRQPTGEDGQVADIDQGKVAAVLGVEVRRVVIVKEHLDLMTMPKNRLISGTSGLVPQGGKDVFRRLARYLEVEGVRA